METLKLQANTKAIAPPFPPPLFSILVRPLLPTGIIGADKDEGELVGLDILCGLDEDRLIVTAFGALTFGPCQGGVFGHTWQDDIQVDTDMDTHTHSGSLT